MSIVYHYTDTGRLPWVIQSGELRPGANRIGDFPDPDFLWATSDPRGDRTASAYQGQLYRSGKVLLVRFTCDANEFIQWREALGRFPQWKPNHVNALESLARERGVDPDKWYVRTGALKLGNCPSIHTKSYNSSYWSELPLPEGVSRIFDGAGREWLSVFVHGRLFASAYVRGPNGVDGYELGEFAGREAVLV